MGKVIKNPVCRRCGYIYDPLFPEEPVLEFVGEKMKRYVMCASCLAKLGAATGEKRKEMLESFLAEDEK